MSADRDAPLASCEECHGTGVLEASDGTKLSCMCWDDPNACANCGEPAPADAWELGWRSDTSPDGKPARLHCIECVREQACGEAYTRSWGAA